jgi:hypothetical protein
LPRRSWKRRRQSRGLSGRPAVARSRGRAEAVTGLPRLALRRVLVDAFAQGWTPVSRRKWPSGNSKNSFGSAICWRNCSLPRKCWPITAAPAVPVASDRWDLDALRDALMDDLRDGPAAVGTRPWSSLLPKRHHASPTTVRSPFFRSLEPCCCIDGAVYTV